MPEIYIHDRQRYSPADENRREGVIAVAKVMANAALTAPKGAGTDEVECQIVFGEEEQERIAKKMEELAHWKKATLWMKTFLAEAVMARYADAILFLGNYRALDSPYGDGCGVCGGAERCNFVLDRRILKYNAIIDVKEEDPREVEKKLINGPLCTYYIVDLGFAVASALLVAYRNFIDAKAFFSMGLAGQKLDYCRRSALVVGVALSSRQKNPFVEVVPDYHVLHEEKVMEKIRKDFNAMRMNISYDYRNWYPKSKKEKEE